MIERCIDLMEPVLNMYFDLSYSLSPQQHRNRNITLLINFGDRAKTLLSAPHVPGLLQVDALLYPDRLGLDLVINVPLLVNAFFKILCRPTYPPENQEVLASSG